MTKAFSDPPERGIAAKPALDGVESADPVQDAVAALPPEARSLVVAGPGTGKTETVAKRLVHLTGCGVRPAQILVLSFSRSAVKTLTKRLEKFIGSAPEQLEDLRHLAIRTFDSWSFRLLRLIGHAPRDLLQRSFDANIDRLVREIRSDRRESIQDRLSSIRHIIIDEAQDLSGVRGALVLEVLRLVAPPGAGRVGFTVLGDEAQAIYGFANRNDDSNEYSKVTSKLLLAEIREAYKGELKQVRLSRNYRSVRGLASMIDALRNILSRPISGEKKLDAMQKLVSRIPEMKGELEPGCSAIEHAKSSAVLTRTNGEVLRVAQKLAGYEVQASGKPVLVRGAGQTYTAPAWVGGTLGRAKSRTVTRTQFGKMYRHLFSGDRAPAAATIEVPAEDAAWQRLVRAMDAGHNATSLDLSVLRERLRWADLMPDDDGVVDAGIHVMTVHQSKGMEFAFVAVLESTDIARNEQPDSDSAEAANVLFVAVSRAGETLARIPPGKTHKPLALWRFDKSGTERWSTWSHGWVNMEMGIKGDVDPVGFVDITLHGSLEAVQKSQEHLATNVGRLRGHKVMLCKHAMPGKTNKFVYGIHLQEGKEPGLLLGKTAPQLTYDLLSRLHGKGNSYPLPRSIFNLRISDVVTMTHNGEAADVIAEDWAHSGLWLGVNLYGTGDFKTMSKGTKWGPK